MRKYAWICCIVLVGLISLSACQSGAPVPIAATVSAPDVVTLPAGTPAAPKTSDSQDTGVAGFSELLSYVSPQWLERHDGNVVGVGLQLADVAQLRKDLAIPPITGASSSKEKVNLILGLANQGFDVASIDSKLPTTYRQYGWDIADVEQALTFRDDYTSIVKGKFDSAFIKEQLEAQSYQASAYGDFTLFLKANKPAKHAPQFAVKDHIVIVGWDEVPIKSLIDWKSSGQPGLDQSAAVQKILPHLDGAWGAFLAPSGTLDNYAQWLKVQSMTANDQSMYKPWLAARLNQTGQLAWDALAISWRGKQPTNLQFLYLYPTPAEAQRDVDLVKESLTTAPSFNRNAPWSTVLQLGDVTANDALLLATATTSNEALIGNALSREEWALFPVRNVSAVAATSTPDAYATTNTNAAPLDSGWIRYTKDAEGFSVALPPEWIQLDLNPATIEAALKKLASDDPALKSMLTEEVRNATANGLKFFGFDIPKGSTSRAFAQAIVGKSSERINLPLETVASALLDQYNNQSTVVKPVTYERIHLPAGDARRFSAKQNLPDGTGKTNEVALTQYVLMDGAGYLYVISVSAPSAQVNSYAPVFEKIAQSFQFVK